MSALADTIAAAVSAAVVSALKSASPTDIIGLALGKLAEAPTKRGRPKGSKNKKAAKPTPKRKAKRAKKRAPKPTTPAPIETTNDAGSS